MKDFIQFWLFSFSPLHILLLNFTLVFLFCSLVFCCFSSNNPVKPYATSKAIDLDKFTFVSCLDVVLKRCLVFVKIEIVKYSARLKEMERN